MSLYTQSKAGFPQPGLDAAREGRAINKYVNQKVPGADEIVLTDETIVYNIPIGKRLVVISITWGVNTASDSICCVLGYCSQENGGGDFTVLTHCFHSHTGAALNACDTTSKEFNVPIIITRAMGHSVTMRVDASDQDCECTLGYRGWYEEDVDAN